MTTVTRFAPSPTGLLHVGNLRTAIMAWIYARKKGGQFILRIDDTDTERSKQEYIDALKEDLVWLGINWDLSFNQSDRMVKYEDAKQKLIRSGRLYPCYETEEELNLKRKNLLSRNLPPIYDRAALKLTSGERQDLEQKGIMPHWRFLLKDEDIVWQDKVRGELKFSAKYLSDPVLVRANQTLTYSLASVVDDAEYGVTDIIRGEDHISNSAVHIQLFEAMGAKVPEFSHISLLSTKEKKLSKRTGGFDVKNLRKNGILPLALLIFLSRIGTSDAVDPEKRVQDIMKDFEFYKLNKATVQYDYEELAGFNVKVIHSLRYEEVKNKLNDLGLNEVYEEFWVFIRGNIDRLEEVGLWWSVCKEDIQTEILDKELIQLAAEQLPEGELKSETWDLWINNIKSCTKKRGQELFLPMRVALTGQRKGPELRVLLPFMDKSLILKRLGVAK
ncbi:glutamate--tRNA ligase [Candidatus Bandiella euplotis]|uniref:Glutamate--tRNA ligase n=1 Tax=Candidatus Bandiella euplotis TaxID=1664265 RepID=A0ABZ0UP17_9RICK|nr:glutamate--tRNA ligase [Candidatus Bandiella woodruffii]WPX97006.1 Glutamate--tRNA ligase [Candidatus Bandiella woodruffii]